MTKENSSSPTFATADNIPSEVRQLVSLPPTLPWESKDLYFAMMASYAQAIRPDDLITWMLIKDLADHRLEIARYRSIKVGFVKTACENNIRRNQSHWRNYADTEVSSLRQRAAAAKENLQSSPFMPTRLTPEQLAQQTKEIEDQLALDIAAAEVEGPAQIEAWKGATPTEDRCIRLFSSWIGDVERIDVLQRAAEERFAGTLRDLERHMQGLGKLLREERDKTIDGELVEPKVVYSKSETIGVGPSEPLRSRRRTNREPRIHSPSRTSPVVRSRKSSNPNPMQRLAEDSE